MLQFDSVYFAYPEAPHKYILEDVSLEICLEETVGVVGRSGVGKSTFLHLLLGLLEPRRGSVTFDNENCSTARLRNPFGLMEQQPLLLHHLNVFNNVVLGGVCGNFSIDIKLAQRQAAELLQLVGLEKGLWTSYPNKLSGGQAQRVALARTLNGKQKRILGLDEPFGSVDTITREILYHRMESILQSLTNKPITFLITHSVAEAVYLCDKILILPSTSKQNIKVLDIPLNRPRKDVPYRTMLTYEQIIKQELNISYEY